MAEESFQEKTEQPTPRRREEARKEGRVARSSDLLTALTLVAMLLVLGGLGPHLLSEMRRMLVSLFHVFPSVELSAQSLQLIARTYALPVGMAFLLVSLAMMATGLLGNIVQVGWLITTKNLAPDWNRVNPISGFGRLFSMASLGTFVTGLLKLLAVGLIAYSFISAQMIIFPALTRLHTWEIIPQGGEMLGGLGWRIAMPMLVIGVADFLFQRWRHERDLRMSKQEIKDEQKQQEGDPHIKQRVRQIQKQFATQRMMEEVPKATVVITNPTHFAIALRYDPETMAAPVVVAKGQNLVALRIKEIARNHDVPMQENKPLARGLFKTAEVGREIPPEFYRAIAQVLAALMRTRQTAASAAMGLGLGRRTALSDGDTR